MEYIECQEIDCKREANVEPVRFNLPYGFKWLRFCTEHRNEFMADPSAFLLERIGPSSMVEGEPPAES